MDPSPELWADALAALDRHRRRRGQGVPTLSVLVGARDEAAAVWRAWNGGEAAVAAWPGTGREAGGAALYHIEEADPAAHGRTLAAAAAALARAAEDEGGRAALTVELAQAAAFLREEPFSRARAVFAEGMIVLAAAAAGRFKLQDPSFKEDSREKGEGRQAAAEVLRRCGARAETLAGWEAASAAVAEGAGEEDRARSAAERFLFDLLEDLPDTAGLFELNAPLGFCFGPMRAEVDLLAADLRLAVEIDGYHHFRDPGGYRRDRRKDVVLQKQGYLVLRFLAEDVVARLEEILEELRAAVAFRKVEGRR